MNIAEELLGGPQKKKDKSLQGIFSVIGGTSKILKKTKRPNEVELLGVGSTIKPDKGPRNICWKFVNFSHSKVRGINPLRHWEKRQLTELEIQSKDYPAAKAVVEFPPGSRDCSSERSDLEISNFWNAVQQSEGRLWIVADRLGWDIREVKSMFFGVRYDSESDVARRARLEELWRGGVGEHELKKKDAEIRKLQAELKLFRESCDKVDSLTHPIEYHQGEVKPWWSSEMEVSLSGRVSKLRSIYVEGAQRKFKNCNNLRLYDKQLSEALEKERNLKAMIKARHKEIDEMKQL